MENLALYCKGRAQAINNKSDLQEEAFASEKTKAERVKIFEQSANKNVCIIAVGIAHKLHMDGKKLYCEHKNQYFPICLQAELNCRVAKSTLRFFLDFLKEIFNSE